VLVDPDFSSTRLIRFTDRNALVSWLHGAEDVSTIPEGSLPIAQPPGEVGAGSLDTLRDKAAALLREIDTIRAAQ